MSSSELGSTPTFLEIDTLEKFTFLSQAISKRAIFFAAINLFIISLLDN